MSQRQPDSTSRPARGPGQIDPRGPRFGAAVTSALLLVAIFLALTGPATTLSAGSSTLTQLALDPGFLALVAIAILFAWSLVAPGSQPLQAVFRSAVQPSPRSGRTRDRRDSHKGSALPSSGLVSCSTWPGCRWHS